jgi:3-oxoacyl-[acyl-carrier-protein] synthase II
VNRRVVITGMGVCTPSGCGLDEFWRNLLAGRSGIGPITLFDASSLPVRIGGEVKGFDQAAVSEAFPEAAGERDRKIWLGLDAASKAITDAGLNGESPAGSFRFVGVSLETFFLDEAYPGPSASLSAGSSAPIHTAVGYSHSLQTPLDRTTQFLGDCYGIHRGRYTNCSACAAGTQAIGEAFRRVRDGSVQFSIAGATDSVLNPLGLGGFSLLRILSTENDQPQFACRPFDATRQGTVLAEGAAFLVMEDLEHARRRGARAYAEVLGYGSSMDAFRLTDPEPSGRGAALSMARAIADAGLEPATIDGVNAHGTGTPKNDLAETLALKRLFGARAKAIPVTANKSMTGHLIAASGAVEAVASVLTLSTGKIPPTINLSQPDPECDLDYVPARCRPFAGRTVLSNSFGFGGQNASLVFGRVEP